MKRFLALSTLLILTLPAQAHFIWLLPDEKDQAAARMVFSDELAPDANVPIAKIAHTKLAACNADGKLAGVKTTADKDFIQVSLDGHDKPQALGGVCQYGVIAKGKGDPFLLMYYPKTIVGNQRGLSLPIVLGPKFKKAWPGLPLEIEYTGGKTKTPFRVIWQGKPLANAEVVISGPGLEEPVTRTTDEGGRFELAAFKGSGYYGIRAKHVEKKEGELNGKAYKEVRHYATITLRVGTATSATSVEDDKPAADPAATKLLADARAARAIWNHFPGFTADLEVNLDGKLHKGSVAVTDKGKVTVKLADELKESVRREISSLVSHRMPGGASDTPCAFGDDLPHHPQGRTIKILNDELHSSYRIKDRQIMEVNRVQGDVRFTISVLENKWNHDKQYLPVSYVVNTWDLKSKELKKSQAHQQTWTRLDRFDLPVTLNTISADGGQLTSRFLTFSHHKLTPGGTGLQP